MNDIPEALPKCGSASKPLPNQTKPLPRILMVEDDALARELNTEALLRCGYEVDTAEDGAEAWEALSADIYDLMITDNAMPKISGLDLLKKMRAARMELPVIMATGVLPKEEFARQPWLNPAATLIKPYTTEQMVNTVQEVLGTDRGLQEQIRPPAPGQDRAF
jgi:DNA-binding NtrC family response regulator